MQDLSLQVLTHYHERLTLISYICIIGPLVEQSIENIKHTFDTNTFAILRICKAAVPTMAKRHSGTIVNIGSIVGEMYVVVFFTLIYLDANPRQLNPMECLILRFQGCCSQHQRRFIHGTQAIQYICASRRTSRCQIKYILQCHQSFRACSRYPLLQLPSFHN